MTLMMKRYLGIVLFLVIFPAICFADQFKCTRVTDGDTINVISNGHKEIIRLVGIDAPETSHKKGEPGQPFS
jgi:endonuclease YncB( thermonuclease family)